MGADEALDVGIEAINRVYQDPIEAQTRINLLTEQVGKAAKYRNAILETERYSTLYRGGVKDPNNPDPKDPQLKKYKQGAK